MKPYPRRRRLWGWFAYTNGQKTPDPTRSDPNVPFDLPDPPQGKFAAVTETNGPGTRILYRDVKLDGRFKLHLSVFYAGVGGLSNPQTLAHDEPANQQFRSTSSLPRRRSIPWRTTMSW